MAKVQMVELSDRIVEEKNGEFEIKYINIKKYPASITNYSLSMGEKLGLISSSQVTDLSEIQRVFEAAIHPNKNREKALEGLNVNQYLKVIYLSVIGMNPQINLSFEEFTEKYHGTIPDTINLYTDLVLVVSGIEENNFAKGLIDSTKKKTEKTGKPPDHQS